MKNVHAVHLKYCVEPQFSELETFFCNEQSTHKKPELQGMNKVQRSSAEYMVRTEF